MAAPYFANFVVPACSKASRRFQCMTRITALKPRCMQHGRTVALDNTVDFYNPLETASTKQITTRETMETRAARQPIRPFSQIFVEVVSLPQKLSTKPMAGGRVLLVARENLLCYSVSAD